MCSFCLVTLECISTFIGTIKVSTVSGTEYYQSKLEEKASFGFEGWGGSFSASADFKTIATSTKNQSTFFTQSEVSCCAYTASILHYDPPPFTNNFLTGVNSLPKNYEKSTYREFILNLLERITLKKQTWGPYMANNRLFLLNHGGKW